MAALGDAKVPFVTSQWVNLKTCATTSNRIQLEMGHANLQFLKSENCKNFTSMRGVSLFSNCPNRSINTQDDTARIFSLPLPRQVVRVARFHS